MSDKMKKCKISDMMNRIKDMSEDSIILFETSEWSGRIEYLPSYKWVGNYYVCASNEKRKYVKIDAFVDIDEIREIIEYMGKEYKIFRCDNRYNKMHVCSGNYIGVGIEEGQIFLLSNCYNKLVEKGNDIMECSVCDFEFIE